MISRIIDHKDRRTRDPKSLSFLIGTIDGIYTVGDKIIEIAKISCQTYSKVKYKKRKNQNFHLAKLVKGIHVKTSKIDG